MSEIISRQRVLNPRTKELMVGGAGTTASIVVVLIMTRRPERPETSEIGAQAWPLILATGMALLSVIIVVRAILPSPRVAEDSEVETHLFPLIGTLLAILFFGFLWHYLHFMVVTPIFVAGLCLWFGQRRWLTIVLYSLGLSFTLYFLFSMVFSISI